MGDIRAVLFDIDGTLVDSNFLHVEAWDYAFTSAGMTVPSWRIQRMIGADSSVLLDELIPNATAADREAATALHRKRYKQLAPRLRALENAETLMSAIADRGTRVVLATSAPQEELDRVMAVLDVADSVHAITSAEDVKKAKPAPDILTAALKKGEAEAPDAMMVGDSVWDIRAASAAGIASIGVLSGGTGESDLREAGALDVFDDVASLLAVLDTSPLAALWSDERTTHEHA